MEELALCATARRVVTSFPPKIRTSSFRVNLMTAIISSLSTMMTMTMTMAMMMTTTTTRTTTYNDDDEEDDDLQ